MTKEPLFADQTNASFPLYARDISCVRGETQVFQNISLDVDTAEAWVVRGVNGAGKTSLLRLLAGLSKPKTGSLLWEDEIPPHDEPERAMFIGHQDGLKPSLTVAENLEFWAGFYGKSERWPLAHDPFKILPLAHRPVRVLSAGQKRRVSLSRLLMSSAELWLLDEPTTALDAKSQEALWSVITAYRERGGAVVFTSHGDHGLSDCKTLDLTTLKQGAA